LNKAHPEIPSKEKFRPIVVSSPIIKLARIKRGDESFIPNVGVTQGSVILPTLFNLYCEELKTLIEEEGVSIEDIMA